MIRIVLGPSYRKAVVHLFYYYYKTSANRLVEEHEESHEERASCSRWR